MTDYRAGVEAAVSAAMESGESNLGGVSPQRFVSGLAKDLGKSLCSALSTSGHGWCFILCFQARKSDESHLAPYPGLSILLIDLFIYLLLVLGLSSTLPEASHRMRPFWLQASLFTSRQQECLMFHC